MGCRTAAGLLQRLVIKDRILSVDVVMPLLFDLLMAFYLSVPIKSPYVTWRGIRYRVSVDGNIKEVSRTPP
jgi:hypothetical protein